jgi:hypothetical protein
MVRNCRTIIEHSQENNIMSQNRRPMAEVSVYAVTSRDLDTLRGMKGVVSSQNPLRVHRNAYGLLVSLGMFHNGQNDADRRLAALGFSTDIIGTLAAAAEGGASYLDINANAPGKITKKSYLDLSTAHLRVQDGDLLEGIGSSRIVGSVPLLVHSTEHGYVVDMSFVRTAAELKEFGFSDEFVALIALARENEASFIDFDTDADYEPGHKIFDQITDADVTADHFEDAPAPN